MKGEEFIDFNNHHYFSVECRLINTVNGTNNNHTRFLTVENGLCTYLR